MNGMKFFPAMKSSDVMQQSSRICQIILDLTADQDPIIIGGSWPASVVATAYSVVSETDLLGLGLGFVY